jgi:signal peptidase I
MRKRRQPTIAVVVGRLAVCALAIGAPGAALAGCGGGSAHAPDAAARTIASSPSAPSTTASTTSVSAALGRPTSTAKASAKSPRGGSPLGGAGHSAPSGEHGGPQAGAETDNGAVGNSKKGGSRRGGADHAGHGGASGGKPAAAGSAPGETGAGSAAPNAQNGVPYEVHTAAMEPTYKPFTMTYYDPTQTSPQIGQVILFYLPAGAEEGTCASPEVGGRACAVASPGLSHNLSLARVVGLPGEEIAIQNGLVVRNGQPVSEPSIQPCGEKELASEPGCEYPKAITVPPASYYVMADNRQLFQDASRGFGAVVQEAVVGTLLGS